MLLALAMSKRLAVPRTFDLKNLCGDFIALSTWLSAPKWTIASISFFLIHSDRIRHSI